MTNEQIIKASIDTGDLAAGGILLPSQAKKFLQMVFDSTELLNAIRTVIMPTPIYEIDKIGVGQRIMRGMTENQDMSGSTRTPTFGKIELTAKKYALPWEISEDALEDNIEGQNFEDVVASLFSTQMGLDTEDLGINGDLISPSPSDALNGGVDAVVTTLTVNSTAGFPRTSEAGYLIIESENIDYTGKTATTFTGCTRGANSTTPATHVDTTAVTWLAHELIGNDDGWLQKLYDGSSPYTDLSAINSGAIDKDHFFAIERALPKKYRRGAARSSLRWLMGAGQKSRWTEALTERATAAGDAALGGGEFKPLGYSIMEIASWPEDTMCLTDPRNFILGIWRQIKVRKTDQDKESIMKDLIFYNTTTRIDFEVEETEAASFGDGLVV